MSEYRTVADVEAKVAELRSRLERHSGAIDNEVMHADEDQLYLDVLSAIAAGWPRPEALAAAALKASEIEYVRWYA